MRSLDNKGEITFGRMKEKKTTESPERGIGKVKNMAKQKGDRVY
jgi:hypothetical protein